jgi:hypothetical protein
MQVFTWSALPVAVVVTVFAVQHSIALLPAVKTFLWERQTSLLYVMPAFPVAGMPVMLPMR